VNTTFPSWRRLLISSALVSLGAPLAAQTALLAEHDGRMVQVGRMDKARPFVEVDGRWVEADGRHLVLAKSPEFDPVLITIRHLNVRRTGRNVKGRVINNEFHFHADLETPYRLENVFLVLDMNVQREGKVLFAFEVGTLEPRELKTIALTVPLTEAMGPGHHRIHLYANGTEVLHSEMPAEARERAIDRLVAKRIGSVQEADPKPLVGPAPEYPASLLKEKRTGHAVISLRVDADGRVSDPSVKSATDPAFGEAALAAARLWRFLPRVKGGQPIESQVDLPFDFAPEG